MSSSINDVLKNTIVTTVTNGKNKSKPIVTIVEADKGDKYKEADQLFADLEDLVNEDWKPWYCHHFHRIGRERTMILAAQARVDGFNKRKLFSHMLKVAK